MGVGGIIFGGLDGVREENSKTHVTVCHLIREQPLEEITKRLLLFFLRLMYPELTSDSFYIQGRP